MRITPTDLDVDPIMERATSTTPRLNPVVIERITHSILSSLRPVKPLPRPGMQVSTLVLGVAVVAVVEAAAAGFEGLAALGSWRGVAILATIALLAAATARQVVARWTPGVRLSLNPGVVIAGCCLGLVTIFAVVLHDYRSNEFVATGVACLEQGILHAVPAGVLAAALMHRGFATRPTAAVLTGGALAGLAGLTFLELHCANLSAVHRMVWHTAVIPVSSTAAALVSWFVRWFPRSS